MLLFQVMFFSCFPASLYSRLHPPGWCILPLLERQHRDTWTRLRDMMSGAAAGARALMQILVIMQVRVMCNIVKLKVSLQVWVTLRICNCSGLRSHYRSGQGQG